MLEIQEAPPSPIGRAILWTLVLVFTTGVLWATLGWIDIVATAQGKIIPSGYSKVIQPYESGVIAAIYVQDGQVVKKGDVLIELDPTLNRADYDRAANEFHAAQVEAARLRALIASHDTFDAPPDAEAHYVVLQQQLLRDQLAEYRAKVAAARHLIEQRAAAVEQTRENIVRLETTVPMEAERADAYKTLLEHDAVTKMDFLQAEGQRIDKQQELAGQRKKLTQDRAALAEAENNYRAMLSEFQQTKQAELSAVETKTVSLVQEVTKAGQKAELQRLLAPIDGVVQQLAVHTVGGVVTPAQQLLIVVPQDHPVEVEAQVENKDVGFVKEGQPVEVKVETFPFTLYGTIPGHVLTVSDDAAPIEKVGLVYPTRVSMEPSTIQVEGKQVNLSPGMAVTVEIKTGQRRVIEYLLSPLLKSVKESLRER
ncbi:HlyD family type I secretion periplasmic adaptor subunit [Nitrospira moscoviensis]|uniref:HlyD family type I secretion periplasmic adaptor subunit n=1 Tax=Nitrospira moscoviensis TaxID=42253 RepID=UPI0006A7C7A7|nr:HlyD family type I secretion periplasmic adaptor subunit [Nitrospira moscoviensis]